MTAPVLSVKNQLQEAFQHPLAEALNPWAQNYVEMRWLSSGLNPYQYEIGAAIACTNLPNLKIASVFEAMRQNHEQDLYRGVETLVVPYGNAAQAAGILAPIFGIKRIRAIFPGDKDEIEDPWENTRVLDVFGHPANPYIHEFRTGPLLAKAAGGPIGLIAVAMGSCSTIVGLSRHFKRVHPDTIIIGVRPKPGECVPGTLDGEQMERLVKLPYGEAIDELVEVSRMEALAGALALRGEITPQPGFSSGLTYAGLMKFLSGSSSADLREVLHGRRAVFICPDDGRSYPELSCHLQFPPPPL